MEITYLEAIRQALWEEMDRDERVFILGEDIGVYGGAFKVTDGFIDRFGPERVLFGTGPTTVAPVRSAVSTIRCADWSSTR